VIPGFALRSHRKTPLMRKSGLPALLNHLQQQFPVASVGSYQENKQENRQNSQERCPNRVVHPHLPVEAIFSPGFFLAMTFLTIAFLTFAFLAALTFA
jgi:hypothetical protein